MRHAGHLDTFFAFIFVHEAALERVPSHFLDLLLKLFLFFFIEGVVISVSTPEPRQEFLLSNVLSSVLLRNDPAEENLKLSLRNVKVLKSNEALLQLVESDSLVVVRVYHVKHFIHSDVMSHQVSA